jgi:hypothetical protein
VSDGSLLAALSQAFVAFTIEADNEFESRMPHRTAADRGDASKTGPWLTSLTYWSNYLRQIPDDGLSGREIARRAGDGSSSIHSRLGELHRWGYVRIAPRDPETGERIVTLTPGGILARDTWAPIESLVEQRWIARFGADAVATLRSSLEALPVGDGLPLGFPILAWDRARGLRPADPTEAAGISTLLARAVLAMAIDFDARSTVSLAETQLLLPLMDEPVPIRELPVLAGISKEAIAIETSRLADGLAPPDGGWRSRSPYRSQTRAVLTDPVEALPRFPMVSHRGGYPDGS